MRGRALGVCHFVVVTTAPTWSGRSGVVPGLTDLRGSDDTGRRSASVSLARQAASPKTHRSAAGIRKVVEVVLVDLEGEFDAMYSPTGRPSVPPEQLLKATVLRRCPRSAANGPSVSG
jgi:hypothetical protein